MLTAMKRFVLSFAVAVSLVVALPPALGAERLIMPRAVRYDPHLDVPARIRKECELEFRLADAIRDGLRRRHDRIESADEIEPRESGLVLGMTIIDVVGRPRGIKTGAKSLAVKGTLWRDGVEIGDFVARRSAVMDLHTCKLLYRSADRIAADVVEWYASPVRGARLGDAH